MVLCWIFYLCVYFYFVSGKCDYISLFSQFVARVIEEEMFGVDNMCWIASKATLEASKLAEFLVLQTGMTAFGKAYYRKQGDLVPNVCFRNLAHRAPILYVLILNKRFSELLVYSSVTCNYDNSLQPSLKHLEMNTCVMPWTNAHQC
jgi:hypothetical protein